MTNNATGRVNAPIGTAPKWNTDREKDPYRKAFKQAEQRDPDSGKKFKETLDRVHEGGKKSNG